LREGGGARARNIEEGGARTRSIEESGGASGASCGQ